MTNQEAIKRLTAKAKCLQRDTSGIDVDCNSCNCGSCELCYEQGTMGKQMEALTIAISALEKQIPKKFRITTSTKRCATCGRQLSGIGNIHPERRYCQRCGQAIDWEDGEGT